jgi:hypothetical protein
VENVGKSRRILRDFSKHLWKSPLPRDFHRCGIFHQACSFTGAQPQHVGGTHLKARRTIKNKPNTARVPPGPNLSRLLVTKFIKAVNAPNAAKLFSFVFVVFGLDMFCFLAGMNLRPPP